jgi:hypothetical protein
MRYLLTLFTSLHCLLLFAQADSIRKIEPERETSFDNYELLIIAILGLLILMGLRFWFRRRHNKR